MRSLIVAVLSVLLLVSSARADTSDPALRLFSTRPMHDPGSMSWPSCADDTASTAVPLRSDRKRHV